MTLYSNTSRIPLWSLETTVYDTLRTGTEPAIERVFCYNEYIRNCLQVKTSLITNEIVLQSNNGFNYVKTWFYILINHRTLRHFFGQSKFSRKEQRHKDEVYNKVKGDWSKDGYSVFWIGITQEGAHLDKKCHKKAREMGKEKIWWNDTGEGSNEIFEIYGFDKDQIIDTWVNIVRETYGELETEEKLTLSPYKHQIDFLTKISSDWENWKDFLLFAKCRAGKTVMTYLHILDKNYRVSLMCSYRNSPKQSWFEDLKKFSVFECIRIVDMRDKNWEEKLKFYLDDPKIQIILWCTVQGMKTTNNRLEKLKNITSIDFLVFDESHIGKNGDFKKIRDEFSDVRCLSISGTAYKQIWEYPEDRRFVYSYYEEQLDNMRGIFNPLRPKFMLTVVKYISEEYRKIYGDDPDALKNIFSLNADKTAFRHPELVREFIHKHFAPQRHLKNPKDRLLHNAQHILISLPSIGACHLFAEMIESYYVPLVVTSDTKNTSEDIENHLKMYENAKTITITCEANVLGVTQERWDTIICCKEGSSREFWTQFVHRGGSGDKDWHVIDFCPQRALECISEDYITNSERNPEIREKGMVDFVFINQWEDGYENLTQEKIYDIMSTDITSATRLISGIFQKIDKSKLKNLVINLDIKSGKQSDETKEVNDNGANGKSNEITVPSDSKKQKDPTLTELDLKEKALKAIGDSLPLVIFWELKDGTDLNSIESVINSQYYVRITEDYDSSLQQSLDLGLVEPQDLMYRIMYATSWIKTKMIEDETMTIQELSITKNENRNIPVEFLDDMFLQELFV